MLSLKNWFQVETPFKIFQLCDIQAITFKGKRIIKLASSNVFSISFSNFCRRNVYERVLICACAVFQISFAIFHLMFSPRCCRLVAQQPLPSGGGKNGWNFFLILIAKLQHHMILLTAYMCLTPSLGVILLAKRPH